MIDFGLAEKFLNVKRNPKEKVGMVGTARYTSINSQLGFQQSRKDDLESIGYMMVFFLKGALPWQDIVAATKEQKYNLILQIKMNTSIEKLCEGVPSEVMGYFRYVKNLGFDERIASVTRSQLQVHLENLQDFIRVEVLFLR